MPKPRPADAVHALVKAELEDWYKEIAAIADERDGGRMHPRKALEVVGKFVTEANAIATTDIGNTSSTANSYLRFRNPKRHVAADLRQHRVRLPGGSGRAAGLPRRRGGGHRGHGAWGMSLFEVPTAVQFNLPVIATVYNNGPGAPRRRTGGLLQQPVRGRGHLVQLLCQDRRGHGAVGYRVNTQADLAAALDAAHKSRKPAVIEIIPTARAWRRPSAAMPWPCPPPSAQVRAPGQEALPWRLGGRYTAGSAASDPAGPKIQENTACRRRQRAGLTNW
jgi:sulfoacetaldehyde acetyltransferase